MTKRVFIFFLMLELSCTALKPKVSYENDGVLYSIQGKFDIVEIDKLNFIYTQSDNNILSRHQLDTKSKLDYVDNRLGKIDDLDPFDPLNIMLFYKSYGIIKILDNTLNIIKIINFREFSNYQNVVSVCSSNDGRFWIFDESIQKIVKINSNFEKFAETNRLSDLGVQLSSIIKMRESNNQLFVLVEGTGILVFDNFGQFIRKVVVPKIVDFSLNNAILYYTFNDEVYRIEGIDIRKLDVPRSIQPLSAVKINGDYIVQQFRGGINYQKID